MSKLIKANINLSKIDKKHIFKGDKGLHINLDIWLNDEPDKFGNDASIKHVYKVGEEFEGVYLGNGKIVTKVVGTASGKDVSGLPY